MAAHFQTLATGNIHYYDFCPPQPSQEIPLVFLHGSGLDATTFLPVLTRLAQQRRVLAPDLPGAGLTQCQPPLWDYKSLAAVLQEWLIQLELGKFNLMGHSLGGGVALELAALSPLTQKLVLLDSTGAAFNFRDPNFWFNWRNYPRQLYQQTRQAPSQNWQALVSFGQNLIHHPLALVKILQIPFCFDLIPTAERVQNQTLLVWGRQDCTTPLSIGLQLAQHLPRAQLLVLPGNFYHDWPLLFPEKTQQLVNHFLTNSPEIS